MRALARRAAGGKEVAVLVTVPVSRALVKRYREMTGLNVRPFFVEVSGDVVGEEGTSGAIKFRKKDGKEAVVNFNQDQFGEPMPGFSLTQMSFPCPVFIEATEWLTGVSRPHWAFAVDWSWGEAGKQFWSNAVMGRTMWSMLFVVAVAFVVLELLALFSAAWMTRAVTGTVHKLYRATESVKRGDFSHRIRTRSRDQLGELALAFNDMSSNIETLLAERVEHERLKREVEIAHEVQAQLFPRSTPALSSASMTGECRAALGVAGDYYDYVEVVPGLVAFALGDVSGKGLSASLVMSNLQAALRAQVAIISERLSAAGLGAVQPAAAVAVGADGGQAVEMPCGVTGTDTSCAVSSMAASINGQLCRATDANRFATLFLALYDDARAHVALHERGAQRAAARARGRLGRAFVGGRDGARRLRLGAVRGGADAALGGRPARRLLRRHHRGAERGGRGVRRSSVSRRSPPNVATRRSRTSARDIFDDIDRWSGDAERGDDQTLVILKTVNREP